MNAVTATTLRTDLENIFKENDSAAIFIDGYTAVRASKAVNLSIDWKKFADEFRILCRVRRLNYYASIKRKEESEEGEWNSIYSWLAYNGYIVTTSIGIPYEYEVYDHFNKRSCHQNGVRSGIDILITRDICFLKDKVDHVILFTDNEDFVPVIDALRQDGVSVTVIGNSITKIRAMHADTRGIPSSPKLLIRSADNFIELSDLAHLVKNVKADETVKAA